MTLSRDLTLKMRQLRERGYSIPEISSQCGVAKSSVLRHVKDVRILPRYQSRWLLRRNASKIMSSRNWELASKKALRLVDSLDTKNLALIAAMLYWAEGSKKDFSFSNTDPNMVRLFILILKRVFHIRDEDFKVSLRIYADIDRNKSLRYWSGITGLRLNQETSVYVLDGSKNGKLQYGMCRLRVKKGGLLLKEFFSLIKRVYQLAI